MVVFISRLGSIGKCFVSGKYTLKYIGEMKSRVCRLFSNALEKE